MELERFDSAGPQARHYVAQLVSEVRAFRRKAALRDKGWVSWRINTTFLPEAGAQRKRSDIKVGTG